MKKHTMPVLSEQEREIDIAQCLEELAALEKNLITWGDNWKDYIESKIRRQKIALAALTAESVEHVIYKGHLLHASDLRLSAHSEPELYYSAPPVPVKQEGEQP